MRTQALFIAAILASCGSDDATAPAPAVIAWDPPPNPHLADSAWAIFHRDSYAQHHSPLPAVTGEGTVVFDEVPLNGIPIFVLFDPDDDILTVAKGINGASLWKIDRETLTPIASFDFPEAPGVFAATYGFIDAEGRAIFASGQKILRIRSEADMLVVDHEADLSALVTGEDGLVAISALYDGNLAYLSARGVLGVIPADLSETIASVTLEGLEVSNGFSVDEDGGIYIVAGDKVLRVGWDGSELTETWREAVAAPFPTPRPGRLGIGSGTTPALMMEDWLAIADDAESMNLIVMDRHTGAEVCKLPVFDEPAATDNAIVVAGRTMIVEQNLEGGTGVARFDLLEDGTCQRTWVSPVHAPTCVPTLSTATGLVYVYTQEGAQFALEALSLEDGHTVFRVPTGTGPYNNYYSAVTIGPDGRVYVGTLVGLLVFRDEP